MKPDRLNANLKKSELGRVLSLNSWVQKNGTCRVVRRKHVNGISRTVFDITVKPYKVLFHYERLNSETL
jgi:hypothetical protein